MTEIDIASDQENAERGGTADTDLQLESEQVVPSGASGDGPGREVAGGGIAIVRYLGTVRHGRHGVPKRLVTNGS